MLVIKVMCKVTISFTRHPLFQWYPQNKEIVGAVKIFVVTVEVLKKKEREDEIQFTTKIGGKTRLGPSYFVL
jgi:hypothetical protein